MDKAQVLEILDKWAPPEFLDYVRKFPLNAIKDLWEWTSYQAWVEWLCTFLGFDIEEAKKKYYARYNQAQNVLDVSMAIEFPEQPSRKAFKAIWKKQDEARGAFEGVMLNADIDFCDEVCKNVTWEMIEERLAQIKQDGAS